MGISTARAAADSPSLPADSGLVVPVWPVAKMPGTGAAAPEQKITSGNFTRITNVSNPTLTVYPAPSAKEAAPAIVVCPGGAYKILSIDHEGAQIAAWLNSLGITAVVLKYRVPDNKAGALQDLERAVRLARANQKAWNIDPTRLGVMGFSAGGNLCARLLAESNAGYGRIDVTDDQSCRPDFVTLIYPAYMGKDGQVAANVAVHGPIPPLFISQADDDRAYMPGTKIYEAALTAAQVPHEFAEYATGGHGYGLGKKDAAAWPERYRAWLTQNKILRPAN